MEKFDRRLPSRCGGHLLFCIAIVAESVVIPVDDGGITGPLDMTTMTSKGQVTVPKRLRDATGLKPGSRVAFELEGGRVIMTPQGKVRRSRFAKVRGSLKTGMTTDQIMRLLRD